jgi:hypothetical protein
MNFAAAPEKSGFRRDIDELHPNFFCAFRRQKRHCITEPAPISKNKNARATHTKQKCSMVVKQAKFYAFIH